MHDKAHLAVTQKGRDGAHDPELPADLQPLPDLERLVAAQMTGGDQLVAAPQLIAIVDAGHRPDDDTSISINLDEGRSYAGLDYHIALATFAHVFRALERRDPKGLRAA